MNASAGELRVALVATILVVCFVLYRWLVHWFSSPKSPDPWSPEIAEALESPEATPICPHCQAPHQETHWFCHGCGRAVGDFTNLLAPFYAFTIGDVLRDGIDNSASFGWPRRLASLVIGASACLCVAPLFLEKAFTWLWVLIGYSASVIIWPVCFGMFVRYAISVLGATKVPKEETSTELPPPQAS